MIKDDFYKWLKAEVTKLRLEPGDIAVVSIERSLTREQFVDIQKRAYQTLGSANKVLIVAEGIKLSALSAAEIQARLYPKDEPE